MTPEAPSQSPRDAASGSEGYVYQRPTVAARTHLSRYPMQYGVLALFLLAMVLVPQVRRTSALEPVAAPTLSAAGSTAGAGSTAAGTAGNGTIAVAPIARPSGVTSAGSPVGLPRDGASGTAGNGVLPETATTSAPTDTPTPPAPAPTPGPTPAAPGLVELPALPSTPLPPVPAQAMPVLGAIAPIVNTGCTAAGLAAVVVSVAAPAAGDAVPVAEIVPYLATVYIACAMFPPPSAQPLICDIDEQLRAAGYPADVSGLAKSPNVIGMGVEVLYGIERAIEAFTGQNAGAVDTLAAQLGCEPDAG